MLDLDYIECIAYVDGIREEGKLNDFRLKKIHRTDGPALMLYNLTGLLREEYWINGKLHRENKPAIIYYENEYIISEEYWLNGKLHRIDGPAVINYLKGKIRDERYLINGKFHNKNSPAIIYYNEIGEVIREVYYNMDMPHRIDGPAVIDKTLNIEEYYIDNAKMSEKEFRNYLFKKNFELL